MVENLTLDLPISACAPNVDPKLQELAHVMSGRVAAVVQRELQSYVGINPMTCDVTDLLKLLGNWQPGDNWQAVYALMYDTIHALLLLRKLPEPAIMARDIVICIAETLGKTNVYFPTIEPIRIAVRDSMIHALAGTLTVSALAHRFDLSVAMVYHLIDEQRALRRPQQSNLFEQVAA